MQQLLEIAADQHGFVTTDDARAHGLDPAQLRALLRRGWLERRAHGVYFVPQFGMDEKTEYQEAVLWTKGRGVVVGESALGLWELADVNPRRIDLVVPPEYNPRKRARDRYRVVRRKLEPADVTAVEGIAVTTPRRSIRDAFRGGMDPRRVRQAIQNAQERGLITRSGRQELEGMMAAAERS